MTFSRTLLVFHVRKVASININMLATFLADLWKMPNCFVFIIAFYMFSVRMHKVVSILFHDYSVYGIQHPISPISILRKSCLFFLLSVSYPSSKCKNSPFPLYVHTLSLIGLLHMLVNCYIVSRTDYGRMMTRSQILYSPK